MTFLFDIGNVLLKLHFERFHEAVFGASDAPLPPEFIAVKDPYESGALDDHEFIRRSLETVPTPLSPESFTSAWQDIFSANDPMWSVVDHLKASGHRLVLFSNTNNLHAEAFLKAFPGFSHFDHHHFSHQIGAMKPDPAFYHQAIDTYGLNPSDTLYLDDLAENIDTGRNLGFHSWQYDFNDHKACLGWLASHGITLPDSH